MRQAGRRQIALEAAALGLTLLVALAFAVRHWHAPITWTPDTLYYEAMVLEVRGASEHDALRQVFTGPLAASARAQEGPPAPNLRQDNNPRWVDLTAVFYRRRWVVPALAAAVWSWFGARSLLAVSLVGYVLLAPLLYLLLRRRFPPVLSAFAAIVCLSLPPLKSWSLQPSTDSWGLALEVGCLLLAILALERGPGWIPAWMLAMAAASFTRDTALVALAAAVWLAIRDRSRIALTLAASGAAAILPAFLIYGESLRDRLAYIWVPGKEILVNPSWGLVLRHYPHALKTLLDKDLHYMLDHPVTGVAFVVGVGVLVLGVARGDPFRRFLRAAAVGTVLYLLAFSNFGLFRFELMLVPMLAAGLAALGAAVLVRAERSGAALRIRRAS